MDSRRTTTGTKPGTAGKEGGWPVEQREEPLHAAVCMAIYAPHRSGWWCRLNRCSDDSVGDHFFPDMAFPVNFPEAFRSTAGSNDKTRRDSGILL
jgi:hypothetical protein